VQYHSKDTHDSMARARLDAIDRKILAALQNNGRLSNVELAALAGLSPSACLRRVQALEGGGVLVGYAARLDPKKVGLGLTAFVQVQIAQDRESDIETFRRTLDTLPEVVSCYAVTGDHDYVLKVVAPDLEAYEAFAMKRLLKLPGVRHVQTSFVLEVVKDAPALPLTYIED
jgi:Lrp/AsnC family leucine-responsive transcriptional regulator